MQSASLVVLLQAALSLLALVQTTPDIPQSLQTSAIQTAEQALSLGTTQMVDTLDNSQFSIPDNSQLSALRTPSVNFQTTSSSNLGSQLANSSKLCPDPDNQSYPICTAGTLIAGPIDSNGCATTQCVAGGPLDLTPSPASGSAPLQVQFTVANAVNYTVSFGDGSSGAFQNILCSASGCYVPPLYHTYTSPGLYTIEVLNSVGGVIGTAQVTVTAPNSLTSSPVPGATIDSNSFTQTSSSWSSGAQASSITVSGTAIGVHSVRVVLVESSYTGPTDFESATTGAEGLGYDVISDTPNPISSSNSWTASYFITIPGSFTIHVYDFDSWPYQLLTSGSLLVTQLASTTRTVTITALN